MRQGLDARLVISWVQEMKTEYDGTEERPAVRQMNDQSQLQYVEFKARNAAW
jgi:hypothetical protein